MVRDARGRTAAAGYVTMPRYVATKRFWSEAATSVMRSLSVNTRTGPCAAPPCGLLTDVCVDEQESGATSASALKNRAVRANMAVCVPPRETTTETRAQSVSTVRHSLSTLFARGHS